VIAGPTNETSPGEAWRPPLAALGRSRFAAMAPDERRDHADDVQRAHRRPAQLLLGAPPAPPFDPLQNLARIDIPRPLRTSLTTSSATSHRRSGPTGRRPQAAVCGRPIGCKQFLGSRGWGMWSGAVVCPASKVRPFIAAGLYGDMRIGTISIGDRASARQTARPEAPRQAGCRL
jgi:hypothetical protein